MKLKLSIFFLVFAFCSQGLTEEEAAELVADAVAEAIATTTTTSTTTTTLAPTTTTSTTTTTLAPTTTTSTTIPKINYVPELLDINFENVEGNIGFSVTIRDRNNVFTADDLRLVMLDESRIFFNNGEKTYSTTKQDGIEYSFGLNFSFSICSGPISEYKHPNKTSVGCFPAQKGYFFHPSKFNPSVPYSYEKISNDTFKFGGNFNVGNRDPNGRGMLTVESIKNLKKYFKYNSDANEFYIVATSIEYKYSYFLCDAKWLLSDSEADLILIEKNELPKYFEKPKSYHRYKPISGYNTCPHLNNLNLPKFLEPYYEVLDISDGNITYAEEVSYDSWYTKDLNINKFVQESKLSNDYRIGYFDDSYGNRHLVYKLYP